MHTFKDNSGREWHLSGNFDNYARVHADTGVRLDDIGTEDRKSLVQLQDTFTLGAVLWSMIEAEANDRGISFEDFRRTLDGTVAEEAYEALLSEMIFFCHPRKRRVLEMAVRKVKEAEARMQQAEDAAMRQAEAEIDSAIEQLIRGSSATSSPESSASTQDDGAFASLSGQPKESSASIGITQAASLPN